MNRGILTTFIFIIFFIHNSDLQQTGSHSGLNGNSHLSFNWGGGDGYNGGGKGGTGFNGSIQGSWSISSFIQWIRSIIIGVVKLPLTIPKNMITVITTLIGDIGTLVSSALQMPMATAKNVITILRKSVSNGIQGLWNILVEIRDLNVEMISGVNGFVETVLGFIVSTMANVQIFGIKIFYNIAMWMTSRMNDIVATISGIIVWTATQIVDMVRGGIQMLHLGTITKLPVINQVANILSNIGEWNNGQIVRIMTELKDFVKRLVYKNRSFFGPVFNWILNVCKAVRRANKTLKSGGNFKEFYIILGKVQEILNSIKIDGMNISYLRRMVTGFMKDVGKGYPGDQNGGNGPETSGPFGDGSGCSSELSDENGPFGGSYEDSGSSGDSLGEMGPFGGGGSLSSGKGSSGGLSSGSGFPDGKGLTSGLSSGKESSDGSNGGLFSGKGSSGGKGSGGKGSTVGGSSSGKGSSEGQGSIGGSSGIDGSLSGLLGKFLSGSSDGTGSTDGSSGEKGSFGGSSGGSGLSGLGGFNGSLGLSSNSIEGSGTFGGDIPTEEIR